jgi:hypothetical protein
VCISSLSDFRKPRPIDWSTRILDLDGDANTTLCKFLMLIPVENVPYDATMIAFVSFSVIARIFSLVSVSVPPCMKKTFLSKSFIKSYSITPCFSTSWYKQSVLPLNLSQSLEIKSFRVLWDTMYCISSLYFKSLTCLQSSSLCFNTKHLIFKLASVSLSISSLVVVTLLTFPNNPSKTSLCVCVPSKVPVNPKRYLQFINLVMIVVNDLDLNRWASSPITHPKFSKYFLSNL